MRSFSLFAIAAAAFASFAGAAPLDTSALPAVPAVPAVPQVDAVKGVVPRDQPRGCAAILTDVKVQVGVKIDVLSKFFWCIAILYVK